MPAGVFSGWRTEHDLNFRKNPPESLVALLGYPKRAPENPTQPYEKFYLLLQPVNDKVDPKWLTLPLNAVLTILRNNVKAPTYLPPDLETPTDASIKRLTDILKKWMSIKASQAKKEAVLNILNGDGQNNQTPEDRQIKKIFQVNSFDLIAWEYISNPDK